MKIERLLATLVAGALLAVPVADAAADTVHMKNGRTLTSSSVRVEGDRVFVRLYRGEVSLPLSLVERIIEDDAVEAPATRIPAPTPPAPDPDDPQQQGQAADPAAAGGDPSAPGAADPSQAPPPPAPEETREHWQNRLFPLRAQLTRMEAELNNLRGRTGADVLAQIGRIEDQRASLQSQVDAIVREARRLGVPAGWLR